MTQEYIYNLLKSNPLNVNVHIGSLEDLNGQDYIFLNYLSDELIGFDDTGIYKTPIEIFIATKDFLNRKILVDFVKSNFNVHINYDNSKEMHYYTARCECEVIING